MWISGSGGEQLTDKASHTHTDNSRAGGDRALRVWACYHKVLACKKYNSRLLLAEMFLLLPVRVPGCH